MKKIVFAVMMLGSMSAFAFNTNTSSTIILKSGDGKHIPPSQVPAPVMQSFNSMFPNARNVQWEVEKEHGSTVYQAEFTQNGTRYKAEFAPDGTFLGKKRA